MGAHTDERDPKTWRTVTTDFPALMGVFPPNVLPEEILSDHPDRTRIVLCCQSNPLRSYADTTAYEEAFKKLDLLVTCELAMTETAALSHYVLPGLSAYESWDGTFFAWTFPEIYLPDATARRGTSRRAAPFERDPGEACRCPRHHPCHPPIPV